MIKIAVCDDNFEDIKSTCRVIEKFFNSKMLEFSIDFFYNSNALIKDVDKYNLIFLDIELGQENGIEVAKSINKLNIDYKLFLVSNHPEYFKDGYRVKAERFFTKPINYEEFIMDMHDVIEDFILKKSFFFDPKISKKNIYINDVLFVEILARKTYLHTRKATYVTPYTLSYWIDTFENYSFSQSHKAFLVNLQNLSNYNFHEVFIIDYKLSIPLSRFYKENFINDYMNFLSNSI